MTNTRKAPEISKREPGDLRWALVERIASSRHLKSSARLREFLFYTADCALRDAPEEATEQQIGIRVFQRNPGYNSSEDSIVRTHARLLRQKLTAYFDEEQQEELVVDIPKGHYLPVFHPRESAPALEPEILPARVAELQPAVVAPPSPPADRRFHDW